MKKNIFITHSLVGNDGTDERTGGCCTMKSRHGRAGKKHIRLQNGNYFLSLQCEVKSARKECFLWGNIIIH